MGVLTGIGAEGRLVPGGCQRPGTLRLSELAASAETRPGTEDNCGGRFDRMGGLKTFETADLERNSQEGVAEPRGSSVSGLKIITLRTS